MCYIVFVTVTLLFSANFSLFGSDTAKSESKPLNTTIPYYILHSIRGNFSQDIYVSKSAFDTVLQNKKNNIQGFQKNYFTESCIQIATIQFTLNSAYDNNPGNSQKIFTVDITTLTYQGKSQFFGNEDEALKYITTDSDTQ